LKPNYFEHIIQTYHQYPAALGVGGYIINESNWKVIADGHKPKFNEFYFDGWKLKENSRFLFRKFLGLDSNVLPGFSPNFSHGRSISFLPPSGKTYEVGQLMGGVSSFKKNVFDTLQFSNYFEGYGLYEDADFTIRVSKKGKLYLNTAAQLFHYHHPSGRPNPYLYGKMVVRNGWYVWRIKCHSPKTIDKIKWHSITLLLTLIRFINIFTTSKRKEACSEAIGRVVGWITILWDKPNKATKK
jgi:GT2 family glycosyltransferase